MIPVPGYDVGTPYGARGPYWSCDENSAGEGIHTGVDYPAPSGTRVVAARPGTAYHCYHGSAFGQHQVEVRCGDGTRDFYAHLRKRVGNGTRVQAGDKVGEVGTEGNVTGPHLHFERHATETGGWSCSVIRDPKPSINYEEEDEVKEEDIEAIAARVNRVLGDYNSKGEPDDDVKKNEAELGKQRLQQIENKVDKILKKLG